MFSQNKPFQIVEDVSVPTPEEEALYKEIEAEHLSCHVMLANLSSAIHRYDQTSLLYEAGFTVADSACSRGAFFIN